MLPESAGKSGSRKKSLENLAQGIILPERKQIRDRVMRTNDDTDHSDADSAGEN